MSDLCGLWCVAHRRVLLWCSLFTWMREDERRYGECEARLELCVADGCVKAALVLSIPLLRPFPHLMLLLLPHSNPPQTKVSRASAANPALQPTSQILHFGNQHRIIRALLSVCMHGRRREEVETQVERWRKINTKGIPWRACPPVR